MPAFRRPFSDSSRPSRDGLSPGVDIRPEIGSNDLPVREWQLRVVRPRCCRSQMSATRNQLGEPDLAKNSVVFLASGSNRIRIAQQNRRFPRPGGRAGNAFSAICRARLLSEHVFRWRRIYSLASNFRQASRYRLSSARTLGNSRNSPAMLGKTMAKIIASEKSITDPNEMAAPITITRQKTSL